MQLKGLKPTAPQQTAPPQLNKLLTRKYICLKLILTMQTRNPRYTASESNFEDDVE